MQLIGQQESQFAYLAEIPIKIFSAMLLQQKTKQEEAASSW